MKEAKENPTNYTSIFKSNFYFIFFPTKDICKHFLNKVLTLLICLNIKSLISRIICSTLKKI